MVKTHFNIDPPAIEQTNSSVFSFVISSILIGLGLGVLLAVGITFNHHLSKAALGGDRIATADARDRFIQRRICSGDGEICQTQTRLYREAMRQFALRGDVKHSELETESKRLKAESLQRALSGLATSNPSKP